MSNILAALGRAQLDRLDEMVERRRVLRIRYRDLFAGRARRHASSVTRSGVDGGPTHDNFWLTSMLVDPDDGRLDAARTCREALAAEDIESRPVWKPMHLQPVFAAPGGLLDGTSERLFATGLSLPSGSALSDDQFDRVAGAITDFVKGQHD